MPQAIIVHGGAWDIPDELIDAHREACLSAVETGWQALQAGRTALDAVEQAIRVMEDHPGLDAGVGSFLNADGVVELDAGIMDGATLDAGSVAAVQGIRYPITLARKVMESEHVLLVGQGAERFALAHGLERCPPALLVIPRELERWAAIRADQDFQVRQAFAPAGDEGTLTRDVLNPVGDTVGAVVLDRTGAIAAGTSTGGTPHKPSGRVGDAPLVGCGYYADSHLGGASCTGWGEGIMRVVLAKAAIDRMADPQTGLDASAAARWAIQHLEGRLDGRGGIILLDRHGRVGHAHNTPRMAFAYMSQGQERPVFAI